ncbi:hypothetical protein AKJ16_DCAP18934 [Drosera capensis]
MIQLVQVLTQDDFLGAILQIPTSRVKNTLVHKPSHRGSVHKRVAHLHLKAQYPKAHPSIPTFHYTTPSMT